MTSPKIHPRKISMILNGAATTQTAKSAKQILAIRRLNAVRISGQRIKVAITKLLPRRPKKMISENNNVVERRRMYRYIHVSSVSDRVECGAVLVFSPIAFMEGCISFCAVIFIVFSMLQYREVQFRFARGQLLYILWYSVLCLSKLKLIAVNIWLSLLLFMRSIFYYWN